MEFSISYVYNMCTCTYIYIYTKYAYLHVYIVRIMCILQTAWHEPFFEKKRTIRQQWLGHFDSNGSADSTMVCRSSIVPPLKTNMSPEN